MKEKICFLCEKPIEETQSRIMHTECRQVHRKCETAHEKGHAEIKLSVSKSGSNGMLVDPAVDHEMLTRAVKKAVAIGLFPKTQVDCDTYLKHWNGMREVLQAAVGN